MAGLGDVLSIAKKDENAINKEYDKLMEQLGLKKVSVEDKENAGSQNKTNEKYLNAFIKFGEMRKCMGTHGRSKSQSIAEYWSQLEKKKQKVKENHGPNLESAKRARKRTKVHESSDIASHGKVPHRRSRSRCVLKDKCMDIPAKESSKTTTKPSRPPVGRPIPRPPRSVRRASLNSMRKSARRPKPLHRRTASTSLSLKNRRHSRILSTKASEKPRPKCLPPKAENRSASKDRRFVSKDPDTKLKSKVKKNFTMSKGFTTSTMIFTRAGKPSTKNSKQSKTLPRRKPTLLSTLPKSVSVRRRRGKENKRKHEGSSEASERKKRRSGNLA